VRQMGATSLTDLSSIAPDANFTEGGGVYPGAQMYIRGVGQDNFVPAQDPGVGVYINDVYYGSLFGANFDLTDLDRVEILRGPQGTLAGANSIGGSVKLYTAQPKGDGSGFLDVGYGSNDMTIVRGAYDVSLIPDQLFLRVAGSLHNDNGYMTRVDYACANPATAGTIPKLSNLSDSCVLGREGGKDESVARVSLRWLATDRLELNFIADLDNVKSQPSPEVLLTINNGPGGIDPVWQAAQIAAYGVPYDSRFITAGRYISYSTFQDRSKDVSVDPDDYVNNYGFAGTVDYKIGEHLNLKSITAYRKVNGDSTEDADGSPLDGNVSLYTLLHKQFSEELRLSGVSFNDFLDWTVGGFYYDATDHLGGQVDANYSLYEFGGLYFQDDDSVKSIKDAVFATATLHPTDQLSIIGGYRYSHSGTSYTFGRVNPDNPVDPVGLFGPPFFLAAIDGRAPESVNERSDYRVAIDYQWTPTLMTYAEVATGFKDGGINPTPVDLAQELPFKPETLTSYEVGIKSEFFDRHTTVNLAGFTSRYKNLQQTALTEVDGLVDNIYTNAGEATISGVEAEFVARPVKELLITASGSYLDFKYDSLGDAGLVPNGPCMSCTNVYTPKYKASFAIQYDINLGSAGVLTPRFADDYTAKMFTDLANTPELAIPEHWVANARLTWRLPSAKWEASLAVTNLFDKYYYTGVNSNYYAGGNAMGFVGRPREALLTLRHTFGGGDND
jgi:iron complex outermembrane recepter protein